MSPRSKYEHDGAPVSHRREQVTKITGIVRNRRNNQPRDRSRLPVSNAYEKQTHVKTPFYGLLPGATPQTPVRFVAVGDLGLARAMKNLTAIPRNCKSMKKFDDNSFASLA